MQKWRRIKACAQQERRRRRADLFPVAGEREWLAKAAFVLIGLVLSELVVSLVSGGA